MHEAPKPGAGIRELCLQQLDIHACHFVYYAAIYDKWWLNGERGHSCQSCVESVGQAGGEPNAFLWCTIGFHIHHNGCIGHAFLLQLATANN
jgi:hypothetical protein